MPDKYSHKWAQPQYRHRPSRETERHSNSKNDKSGSRHDGDGREPRTRKDEPWDDPTPTPNPTALFPRQAEPPKRLPLIVYDFLDEVPRRDFKKCMNYVTRHLEGLCKESHPQLYLQEAVDALIQSNNTAAYNWIEKAVIIRDISGPYVKTSRDRVNYFKTLEDNDEAAIKRFNTMLKDELAKCIAHVNLQKQNESVGSDTESQHYTVGKAPGFVKSKIAIAREVERDEVSSTHPRHDDHAVDRRHAPAVVSRASQGTSARNLRGSGDLEQHEHTPTESTSGHEQRIASLSSGQRFASGLYTNPEGNVAQYKYANPGDARASFATKGLEKRNHFQAYTNRRSSHGESNLPRPYNAHPEYRNAQGEQSLDQSRFRHQDPKTSHASLTNDLKGMSLGNAQDTDPGKARHRQDVPDQGKVPRAEEPVLEQDHRTRTHQHEAADHAIDECSTIHMSDVDWLSWIGPQPSKAVAEERLDIRYKVRTGKRAGDFFMLGRVFSVVKHEDFVGDPKRFRKDKEKWLTPARSGFGYIYSHVQRYTVVKEGWGFCWAVPINTYGGLATTKPGLSRKEVDAHAIAYSTEDEPEYVRGERNLPKLPIAIRCTDDHTLHRASRLNFAKVRTIEHNVRAMGIGTVVPESRQHLSEYWRMEFDQVYNVRKKDKDQKDDRHG